MTENAGTQFERKSVSQNSLGKPFSPDAVSWRVGSTTQDKKRGLAFAYIDARDVQDRLNEVCGPFGWQCRHEVSSDKRITCHIGIRDPETGEWIWKSDGAGETDFEAEKGSYSDSFKRAAVKWGVGRYLYDTPSTWVEIEQHGKSYSIKDSERGKLLAALGGKPMNNGKAPPPPAQSPLFFSLKEDLGKIEDGTSLASWAADVKDKVDRKVITTSERALLMQAYNARAAFIAQAPGQAA